MRTCDLLYSGDCEQTLGKWELTESLLPKSVFPACKNNNKEREVGLGVQGSSEELA